MARQVCFNIKKPTPLLGSVVVFCGGYLLWDTAARTVTLPAWYVCGCLKAAQPLDPQEHDMNFQI